MEPIIEVKNLGKKYNINHQQGRYIALRDVITGIFKSPFKFLKDKTKQITGIQTKEEYWALKDVNFTVKKGEVIGIIGRNGAGKSTLLKILSQITPPTTGEIKIRGRVGSLLEVGTGFHPELTGRENIRLNGAILGMTYKEIANKFDQIVEFAGIEKFLDTPVKYYSSGMYVRLAFSVAAHMEPDILIIDEVLAVGDSEFQKKCLGKMDEISKQDGRTILFVSHNMGVIQSLCKKTLLLEKGEFKMFDNTDKVINHYLNNGENSPAITDFNVDKTKDTQISRVTILNEKGIPMAKIPVSEKFYIKTDFSVYKPLNKTMLSLIFYDQGEILLQASSSDKTLEVGDFEVGDYSITTEIPAFLFNTGIFYFDAIIHKPMIISLSHRVNLGFEIIDNDRNPRSIVYAGNSPGRIASLLDFKIKKIK